MDKLSYGDGKKKFILGIIKSDSVSKIYFLSKNE